MFTLSCRLWPHSSNPDSLFMAVTSPLHTDISLVRESSSGTFVDYCEVGIVLCHEILGGRGC